MKDKTEALKECFEEKKYFGVLTILRETTERM